MNLSKQTSDAIQMLVCCHRAGDGLVKVAQVAKELDLTKQMALKLANILSQAELVVTFRGPSGGIRLSDNARQATIGDIVRRLERAPVPKSTTQKTQLKDFIDDAFEAFLDVLDRNTLSDIAEQKPRSGSKKTLTSKGSSRKNGATSTVQRPARA